MVDEHRNDTTGQEHAHSVRNIYKKDNFHQRMYHMSI